MCLQFCKCFEKRLWLEQHPLRQFESQLSPEILARLESTPGLELERLCDMDAGEIGAALRHPAAGGVRGGEGGELRQ